MPSGTIGSLQSISNSHAQAPLFGLGTLTLTFLLSWIAIPGFPDPAQCVLPLVLSGHPNLTILSHPALIRPLTSDSDLGIYLRYHL